MSQPSTIRKKKTTVNDTRFTGGRQLREGSSIDKNGQRFLFLFRFVRHIKSGSQTTAASLTYSMCKSGVPAALSRACTANSCVLTRRDWLRYPHRYSRFLRPRSLRSDAEGSNCIGRTAALKMMASKFEMLEEVDTLYGVPLTMPWLSSSRWDLATSRGSGHERRWRWRRRR